VGEGRALVLHYFIETAFGVGLIVNALLFVPQIIRLYQVQHAQDISLLTFAGFNFINLFTLLHGVLVKDTLLVFGYSLTLIANTTVTLLIIWYRLKERRANKALQS
jgi:MtN3 and saliva related transmembrane protein